MKKINTIFIQGLLSILPTALTIALVYWLGTTAESILGPVFQWLLPEGWYLPGMGLIGGILSIFFIGILLNVYFFRQLSSLADKLFERIPLVKLIYNSLRDVTKFASTSENNNELQKAVTVKIDGDIKMLGFVTRQSISLGDDEEDLVAVYLPMSYQIGGFTIMVSKSRLTELDMKVQDAMSLVLTAGMTKADKR
tara:strand:+ start:3474 stop:4058 length:585 start_codon:yes stop_codon:yes gene_type:complete